jgi:hypothetical protein
VTTVSGKPKKEEERKPEPPSPPPPPPPPPPKEPEVPFVGTSTQLEKQYLRLTGDSDMHPSNFRPLPILKDSLAFCLAKFEENRDYEYICEQLRSIRQDLTVQHISDPFCITVYETHARLAIEHRDWDNFNQSMNPLELLYREYGKFDHVCEYACHRILYLIGVDDITGLSSFIPKLEYDAFRSPQVQFAIAAWKHAVAGEWVNYLTMMHTSDPLVAGVMSIKAKDVRFNALACIVKASRAMSLADYRELLVFETEDETREFLAEADVQIPPG